MSIAKVIKVIGRSPKGLDDAIETALARVSKTVHGIHGLKVVEWTIDVDENKIAGHKVTLEVAFGVDE